MAENAIAEECEEIPCCIVRPAMVLAAVKDPIPVCF